MAKVIERRRVHCPIKHVSAFILKWDDGSSTVKCGNLRTCGDSCPYLRDPNYKSPFRRAPEYKPKWLVKILEVAGLSISGLRRSDYLAALKLAPRMGYAEVLRLVIETKERIIEGTARSMGIEIE